MGVKGGGTAIVQPLPGIGDMIWHLPHIRAVAAHFGGPVTLIAKPRSAADQIFGAEDAVAEVVWMDRNPEGRRGRNDGVAGWRRFIATLRARRFQRVVLLHHSRSLAFALMAAGIPERHGYGFGLQRMFLNRTVRLPREALRLHPHAQATAWLKAAGIELRDPEPRLRVSAPARIAVRERLPEGEGKLVVVGIGSSEPYKQWGAERFAALISALAGSGWRRFALAGGVAEMGLAADILGRVGGSVVAMTALAWNLGELAALCEAADFYVGNDTGVMNIAAAAGIQSYGLFGATQPIVHTKRIIPILPEDGAPDPASGMNRISVGRVVNTVLDGGS